MNNTLWEKITSVTEEALKKKALHSITCNSEIIEELEIPFIVRIVENLTRKEADKTFKNQKQKHNPNFNPFLPYEKDLFVTDISDSHVAILNKFNVVYHHLLLITRQFESQENVLNYNDLFALWKVLEEIDGLGFYNCGQFSGASQPHKHLQFIPKFNDELILNIPFDNFILSHRKERELIMIDKLPYLHGIKFFPNTIEENNVENKAKITLEFYHDILNKLKINIINDQPSHNYNLLMTRNWIMIVPRLKEKFNGISINSMGFIGALLVKNEEQLKIIKENQPLSILAEVGIKLSESVLN